MIIWNPYLSSSAWGRYYAARRDISSVNYLLPWRAYRLIRLWYCCSSGIIGGGSYRLSSFFGGRIRWIWWLGGAVSSSSIGIRLGWADTKNLLASIIAIVRLAYLSRARVWKSLSLIAMLLSASLSIASSDMCLGCNCKCLL